MRPRIVRNALEVALLVGAVLNLVNQGGRILDGSPVSWLQVIMNFCVPYCVST
ncbi:MAG: nitrate/nitrite transporter NrtS [Pseudogulbenkiania sp.]|nr:nitrate/nitrite transporter NrtS [Pseudogulbenkiania sp.]